MSVFADGEHPGPARVRWGSRAWLPPLLLLSACGGAVSADADGWHDLGDGRDIRIHAGEFGPGCVLIGDPYPAYVLQPDDIIRPDPTFPQCDALVEFDRVDIVIAGDDGATHPAYDSVELQPLMVLADSMYMSFRAVTTPGSFTLTLVHEVDGVDVEQDLRVEAIDPR